MPQQGAVSSEGVVATCVGIGCAARAEIDRRAVHRWRRLDRDVPDPHRPVGDLLAIGEVQRVEIAAQVANDGNRCSFEVCENRRGHGDRGGSIDVLLPGRPENDGCVVRMAVAPDRCRKGRGRREGEGSGCCEHPQACSKSCAATRPLLDLGHGPLLGLWRPARSSLRTAGDGGHSLGCSCRSNSDIARSGPAGAARISHPHRRGKSFIRSVESEYRVWCSIWRARVGSGSATSPRGPGDGPLEAAHPMNCSVPYFA